MCLTLCDPMDCSTLGFPVPHHLLGSPNFMSSESVMLSKYLILCHPLFLLLSIFPIICMFSNVLSVHIRWPKYWRFSFSISPSNDCSRLASFRINCFDLLAVQRTLQSLLHHHNSKPSILQRSAFFMIQLSHLYMDTVKTIVLTIRTFVGKMMPLLFNMLSRFVIALLRSKCLLISWLQSPSAVILEPKKIKTLFPWFPHLFA